MKYSRSRRTQYARLVLIAQDRIALKYAKRYAAEIKRAGKEYAAAYADGKQSKFPAITKQHGRNLKEISDELARECVSKFSRVPWLGIKAAIPDFDTEMEERVYETISKVGAKRVVDIAETTEDQIRSTIAAGLATNATGATIARNITTRTEGLIGRARAATISRTEVHSAANQSQFEMAQEVGVELRREWIAGNDDRVRDWHADADGQVVGPDEPFTVMGEEIMYPGDPSGSPANIINCRCVVGYVASEQ